MVPGLMMAAVVVLQGHDKIDGVRARQVLEASRAADAWVYEQVHARLVPDVSIVQSSGATRMRRQAFQDSCMRDLKNAAYEQVCDAYQVSKKQFNAIVRYPARIMQFDYVPEVRVRRMFNRQLSVWDRMGTRFDPKQVRLKESVASKYGYINPRKPEPLPPSMVIDQLVGPSMLPKGFIKTPASEPEAKNNEFAGYLGPVGEPGGLSHWFAKRHRVYHGAPGSTTRPSAFD